MVCAPQRSGTSCTAEVLQTLGVPMGRCWMRPTDGNPHGFFEDQLLREIARQSVWEDLRPARKNGVRDRIRLLRWWMDRRSVDGPVIGGKYPALCVVVPEMFAAIPQLKLIVPDRPAIDCARSRARRWRTDRGEAWLKTVAARFQRAIDKRDADIKTLCVPHLRFVFSDFTRDPRPIIEQIIRFCGLTPSVAQRVAAASCVDPTLNHCSKP